ncbi:monovalent cation:proton antiporter-2 (CPA2) family protein [Sphingomonas sp.]|jgi:CPA2 family monovalent cation:H+ antiporter-2/glutathione-regulated potassium-efflux system protein KefB|uniref:monovalent cation:proton antiporter-2 (CPA2) family protein n=1 Tax=Sphingomonas sp. TaxID=28214 RepID=UPI002E0FA1A1|nr:monovalent cation:proton antiporter-2 (CPA2) family protein [Sphingomonas sp.]HEV7289591.1 monovalent cation:proton antiporter-2 (CPA2) family protein [Sphingomonas sp.]
MDHSAAHSFVAESAPLLGFALLFVLIFRRMGLGATLGYLVAGALVGPQVLGLVGGAESKMGIAEFGIALLLFLVGLELSPSRLWRMKRDIFGFGLLQVVLCGVALSVVIGYGANFSVSAALALGLPLALSSTAQVLPMLQSAGRMRTPFGERAFSTLLFQDISIVPLITIIAILSRNPADAEGPPGWLLAIYTVAAITGLVLTGRYLLRPLFKLIGNWGERELFVFAALFTVVGAAALMQSIGLSTALGAFIAGVMLADSPYRHEIEADIEPFRSILLGLFFLSVGMMLDLSAIAERPVFVLGMAAALIATKTIVITGLAMAFRMPWRQALGLGLLLSQGGEFGFVLFSQAQNALLIAPEAVSVFSAVVTLSMATTPFLMMFTKRFRADAVEAKGEREGPVSDGSNALIVGYGRFGQTVGQMLNAQGIAVTLIDTDIEMIDIAGQFGAKVYYGDGTRIDMLRQAGAGEAQLILFCLDGDKIEPELVEAVHESFPNASIFVRAYDRRALLKLRGTPASGVVREVLESAIVMARKAMDAVGVDIEEIDRTEDLYRRRDRERLKIQHEAGSLTAAREAIIGDPDLDWRPGRRETPDPLEPKPATGSECG